MQPDNYANHTSVSRLIDVAVSEKVEFTNDELDHLQLCPRCLRLWTQLIYDHILKQELLGFAKK